MTTNAETEYRSTLAAVLETMRLEHYYRRRAEIRCRNLRRLAFLLALALAASLWGRMILSVVEELWRTF